MLSYLHAYHAGNFADAHKHAAFTLALDYLLRKPAPLACLDVYAGNGFYDLESEQAHKTGEAEEGILRLGAPADWPPGLAVYAQAVAAANNDREAVRWYPGSPMLASHVLRASDRLILNEMHPRAAEALDDLVQGDERVHLHRRDALEALGALVPPRENRGLVLIDPSYEQKSEFGKVADAVEKGLMRWRNGVWMIWYPLLAGAPHRPMVRRLIAAAPGDWLQSELHIDKVTGMRGSGMLVLNPPWTLKEKLDALAPWLDKMAPGKTRLVNQTGSAAADNKD